MSSAVDLLLHFVVVISVQINCSPILSFALQSNVNMTWLTKFAVEKI